MNNLFLYARKSTDVEDKQVLSIESQLVELRQFAEREGIRVAAELIEKRSAKIPGRPVFTDMLARIEAGEADGILAWHPDRLARNSMDGGRIIFLLDGGKLKTLKFPTFRFEPDPQGKFMLSIMFGQSKYYVDSLSENTRRGLREKIRRGEYPSLAPLGYLNDYRTRRIIVDRERGPVMRQAFETYATGKATFDDMRKFFGDHGIRTRNGKLLARAHLSKIFANPIYYGHFLYAGELHEGKHEPLISKQTFDQVQALLNRRWRWSPGEKQRQPKAFVGLLRCGECGYSVSAEVQKGHTYYRCSKKSKVCRCSQPYIREEALDAEITRLLRPFALRPDWAEGMLGLLQEEERQAARSARQLAEEKAEQVQEVKIKLQNLLDALLDNLIDHATFAAKKAELMSRKKTLEEQKSSLTAGRAYWLEPFQKWVLAAKNAGEIAVSGSLQAKRVLAGEVFGSNLVLDGKKARGSCVKPWSLLLDNSSSGEMVVGAGFEPA